MSGFAVNGKTYQMVDSKFTFAEADALEKVTGHTFGELTTSDTLRGSAKVIQAFIWVSIKRVDPETKFSDLNDMAIDDIEFEAPQDAPVDPTVAAEPQPSSSNA